jgi:hypothetical protein
MSLRRWENERGNRKGKDVIVREANMRRYLWGGFECDELRATVRNKFDVPKNDKASVLLS